MNKRVEIQESPYTKLAAINVNEHTEKKNGLTFLSWPWAVDQLLRADPNANWEYHEPSKFGKDTWMVSCTVTAFGCPRRMYLPVMDHRNKAISEPDAFQINTAMMRCLVKAIALHGLGLYIYAGEDLPADDSSESAQKLKAPEKPIVPNSGAMDGFSDEEQIFLKETASTITRMFLDNEPIRKIYGELEERHLTNEEKIAVWSLLDSKCRSAIKKHKESLKPSLAEQA